MRHSRLCRLHLWKTVLCISQKTQVFANGEQFWVKINAHQTVSGPVVNLNVKLRNLAVVLDGRVAMLLLSKAVFVSQVSFYRIKVSVLTPHNVEVTGKVGVHAPSPAVVGHAPERDIRSGLTHYLKVDFQTFMTSSPKKISVSTSTKVG